MDLNPRVDVNCGRKDGRTDGRTDGKTGRLAKAGATMNLSTVKNTTSSITNFRMICRDIFQVKVNSAKQHSWLSCKHNFY